MSGKIKINWGGPEVRVMKNFHGYICDGCGYAGEKPGICPFCQAPLSVYTREEQSQYEEEIKLPEKVAEQYRWYV